MRTVSLYESQESSEDVSIARLFEGAGDIAHAVCRGGWPEAVLEPDGAVALARATNCIDEVIGVDIEHMDGVRRNSTWMHSIMRPYARNVSPEAPLSTILADMQGESPPMATVSEYVDVLIRASAVEGPEAWNPRLRSKTAVRTSLTRHFCDPPLAAALLRRPPPARCSRTSTRWAFCLNRCVSAAHGSTWTTWGLRLPLPGQDRARGGRRADTAGWPMSPS